MGRHHGQRQEQDFTVYDGVQNTLEAFHSTGRSVYDTRSISRSVLHVVNQIKRRNRNLERIRPVGEGT